MARVQNTLIGKSSGSVGGTTFSTWKGVNVLKSKAVSVANPKTVPQQTQRNRMALMVSMYRLIAGVITIGFKNQAVKKSEYNAFVQENIQSAILASAPPLVTFAPASLLISKGTIQTTNITSVTAATGTANVVLAFPTTLPIGGAATDLAIAAVQNSTTGVWGYNSVGVARSTGTLTVTMPASVATGNVLNAYLFFASAINEEVSTSAFITKTV